MTKIPELDPDFLSELGHDDDIDDFMREFSSLPGTPSRAEPEISPISPALLPNPSLNEKTAPGWREIVVDPRTGIPRQAGSSHPEGQFILRFRQRAESDLYVFSKGVIGRQYLSPSIHKQVCDLLTVSPPYRRLIMLPRGHCKSSIVSHCLPIHIFTQPKDTNVYFPGLGGRDCRILLACETETRAKDHVRVIQSCLSNNVLLRALWPHICWESPKQSPKWSSTEFIIPRDNEWPDPSLRGIGVGGAITGARPNVQIKDDLISFEAANSDVIMQTAIDWHIASRALADEYEKETRLHSLEFILGCLPGDADILMADGTRKPLILVEPGDLVWSASADRTKTAQTVVRVIPQGFGEVIEIVARGHQLRATKQHPFLCHDGKAGLRWVRASDLQVGDLLVASKCIPGEVQHNALTEDFLWLFGFLFGDGWVSCRPRKGYVCWVPGTDAAQNRRVANLLKKWFPAARFYMNRRRTYRADSVETAQRLQSLGLCGKAKTKRVPAWVFKSPPEYRQAFLLGFCAADGSWLSHRNWAVEISNLELMRDLRHLATLCGVRHGRLRQRTRTTQPPGSPHPLTTTCYYSTFNFSPVEYGSEVGNAGRDTEIDSAGLRFVRVTELRAVPLLLPVYDLHINGVPSFFANGLAVHNTHWAVWDLYTHIEENDPTVEIVKRSIVEDGKPIWPERFTLARVEQLRKEFGSMFPLLYMNEPFDPKLVDFDFSQVREFDLAGAYIKFREDHRDSQIIEQLTGELPPEDTPPEYQAVILRQKLSSMKGKLLTANTFDQLSARMAYLRLKYK